MALAKPDETAIAYSDALMQKISAAIATSDGTISFDRYMDMALYDEDYGYYRSSLSKFGESGDFTTAPEISPAFAISIARVFGRIQDDITDASILEVGAGTGRLAADILAELERQKQLPDSYSILELSAELRSRQQATLKQAVPHLFDRVRWLDRLESNQVSGMVLANEVMDAMPVICFCIRNGEILERRVGFDRDGNLTWIDAVASKQIVGHIQGIFADLDGLPQYDYCSEYNPRIEGWMASLEQHLQRGLMLLVDYGYVRREYYHSQRKDGTLLCHFRHQAHSNPFFYPGLQDISANVDFTAVALAAHNQGLEVLAHSTQASFLLSQGILDDLRQQDDAYQHLQDLLRVKSLIMPNAMGERFQMIAVGKDYNLPNSALTQRDLRYRL